MSRIERTTRARNDAAEIWFYIAQDNDAAADTLLDHIDERLKSLARMPLSAEAAVSGPLSLHDVSKKLTCREDRCAIYGET